MQHRPRKRFSQHFLHDLNIIHQIVDSIAPRVGQSVVEIGPGLGAITGLLLDRLGRLDVVEVDRDIIPPLRTSCANRGELVVHNIDALKFDFNDLAPAAGKIRVVGNLPYHISTPLLFHVFKYKDIIEDIHFLLQKEVVDRITAAANSDSYGRLSVMLQYRCHAVRLFDVEPWAFSPPPRVTSAFVRLEPYSDLSVAAHNEHRLSQIVALAFSHRRKTLKNALKGLLTYEAIAAAGIDPNVRGETLTLQQFSALANQSTTKN